MHHIVITSYQLAVQDSAVFKRKKWYYLILDEAQNIKNYESDRWKVLVTFNSQRRLLLTGTPLQVSNGNSAISVCNSSSFLKKIDDPIFAE